MRVKFLFVLMAAGTLLTACDGGGSGGSGGTGGSGAAGGDGGTGGSGGATTSNTNSTSTSSSTSGSTTSNTDTNTLVCGILYDDRPECQACMDDTCCAELQNCAPDTDCDELLVCANACADGDDTCIQACIDAHQTGLSDLQTLNQCYDDNCSTDPACEYPICDSMLLYPDQACAECLGGIAECCGGFTACATDPTCIDCAGDPTIAGCDMNASYQTVASCFSDGDKCGKTCTTGICDSGLSYPNNPACNFCLGQSNAMGGCCEDMKACADDTTCLACITGQTSGAECDNSALLTAFETCQMANCAVDCGG